MYIIFKDKNHKKSQNSRNQGFSHYYRLMIEGSGAGSKSGTYVVGTDGSGSERPKSIRIRIRNTGESYA